MRLLSLITLASLFSISASASVSNSVSDSGMTCGSNVKKNSFMLAPQNPGFMTASLSGNGPKTAATEILGYMTKAGPKAGVVITKFKNTDYESVRYQAGNIQLDEVVRGNACPPLSMEVTRPTSIWPQWWVSTVEVNGVSMVQMIPALDDAATLVTLMAAAGVVGTPHPWGGGAMNYEGGNVSCQTMDVNGKTSASCSILIDTKN